MGDMPPSASGRDEPVKENAFFAWILLAIVWLATIGVHSLFDPDEGRYAEIPREMWLSGDWITPTLNGLPYFEKPPLQYWATATMYSLVGPSEATSRIWSFVLAFACLPLMFWLARGLGCTRPVAWRAVFLLAVSPFFIIVGHINLLDQGFTFFLLVALASFLIAQQADLSRRTRCLIVSWVALAAAVLSKGIVALVLTGGTLVLHSLVHRDAEFLKRIWQPLGAALFLVIVLPWHLLVESRNPGFAQFFFVHEHFARFLTTVHRRDGPVWYFVPIVLLAALPALGLWRSGIRRAWQDHAASTEFPALRFLVLWCVWVFAFFSVSHSKLPPYVLPLLPPLMLLFARVIEDDRRASGRVLVIQTLLVSVGVVAMLVFDRRRDGIADLPVYLACGVAIIGLAIAWGVRWRQRSCAQHASWWPVVLCTLVGWQAVLPPERSSRDLVQGVQTHIRPATRLFSVHQYRHSLSFYLGRNVTLVAYRGELDEGLRRAVDRNPGAYIDDLKAFVAVWRNESDAMAFIDPDCIDELRALGFEGRSVPTGDTRSIVMVRH